ncbi:MAG: hypothetical protein IKB58_02995, partial [Oscillospiraceae bacterium]|nr:hypothetical protein [Oscillospiraceae bacterium]
AVFDAVTAADLRHGTVTGVEHILRAVVIDRGRALQNIEELALARMGVITNAAALFQRENAEQAGVVKELFLVCKVMEHHLALAAEHFGFDDSFDIRGFFDHFATSVD